MLHSVRASPVTVESFPDTQAPEIKAVEEGVWDGLDRYSQDRISR